MSPAFVLPEVEENADSWGPQTVPPQFDGVPFMPFQKGERLGRIADFGQMAGRGMFAGAPGLLGWGVLGMRCGSLAGAWGIGWP